MKKGIFTLAGACGAASVLSLISSHASAITISVTPSPSTQTPVPVTTIPSSPAQTPSTVLVPPPTPMNEFVPVPVTILRPPSGSTQIVPPGSGSLPLQAKHPGVSIPTLPISNENYSNLPVCPVTPVCPDINENTPYGKTPNCPDSCTVTRSVQFKTVGYDAGAVNQIVSTTDAVCPAGYTGVATYNSAPEIKFAETMQLAPYPVTNANYVAYRNAGYTCTLTPPIGAAIGNKYIQYCNEKPPGLKVNDPHSSEYKPTDKITEYDTEIKGYEGQYTYFDTQCVAVNPFDPYNCNTGPASCDSLGLHHRRNRYYYSYFQCTYPSGLYFTANMIPISIVCSHVRPVWQHLN
jgi:hypothetical protein